MKEIKPKPKPLKPTEPSCPKEPPHTIHIKNETITRFDNCHSSESRKAFNEFIDLVKDVAHTKGYKLVKEWNQWIVKVPDQEIPNPYYEQNWVSYLNEKEEHGLKLIAYQKRLVKYEQDLIKYKMHMKLYYQQQADLIEVET